MRAYVDRLLNLDSGGCLLTAVETRLLLLTGQSSLETSTLSPLQEQFLEGVAPAGTAIVRAGFPFHRAFLAEPFRPASLPAASWNNTRQVLWSLYSARFAGVVAARMQRAADTARARLLIVTGSCGLQLLNSVWPVLRLRDGLDVRVAALGPACFGSPRMPVTVIMGQTDYWSRLFYGGAADRHCRGGHLDYYSSREAAAATREAFQ